MKIIDLLNKIANGEDVPKKILYKYKHLEYDEEYYLTYDRGCYYDEEGRPIPSLLADNLWNLNDEVEITEEEKKIPKKLKSLNNVGNSSDIGEFKDKQQLNNNLLKDKLNEIIDCLDYLKSKGE